MHTPPTPSSLGLCLRAMGYKPPSGHHCINYAAHLSQCVDMRALADSEDPEELLEAATSFTLPVEVGSHPYKIV